MDHESRAEGSPVAGARVLVVDDEPDHSTTICGILAREGIVVCTAASAEEARAWAEREQFHVGVVDLRLPGHDGLEIMHQLRERQPWLEVIILTAYPTPATCKAALSAGAAAYLEKPFSPEAFRALVTTLLERARPAAPPPD